MNNNPVVYSDPEGDIAFLHYSVTRTIQTTHPIDAHGRNMLSYFKVDAGVDRIVSSRVYNAKEQLITNYQGGTGLSGNLAYLQKLDYSYLPNGLLSTINNNVLTGTQALYSVCTAPAPALPPGAFAKASAPAHHHL